jgi:endonuclease YncB( thermonuclease family)
MASEVRACLSAVLLAIGGAAFADELIGQASVIDGDTIEIHGVRVRIFGIDAPESVSYLVCTRLSIDTASDEYLAALCQEMPR